MTTDGVAQRRAERSRGTSGRPAAHDAGRGRGVVHRTAQHSRVATTAALVAELTGRDDAALARLLAARPDLATPAPSSLTGLAARASARPSVERALSTMDTVEIAVAEAVAALAPVRAVTAAALGKAVGVDAGPALSRLRELALVVDGEPVAALVEALGPHPVGLGPTLADLDAAGAHATTPPAPTSGDVVTRGRAATSTAPTPTDTAETTTTGPGGTTTTDAAGTATSTVTAPPTTAGALRRTMKEAPPSAVGTLDALTWGPPVGTVSAGAPPEGAAWLLEHGLLRRLSPTQLVLPREVALAARGGRTHRSAPEPPTVDDLRRIPAVVVAAEGARAAEEIVRLVAALLRTWQHEPATVLRAGGVGVRELRRTAAALEVDETRAALVAELAAMAGLLSQDGDEQVVWTPARTADDWLADPLPLRWTQLARAWAATPRTPWLIGTRSDHGSALSAALEPTLERGWALELRRRILATLTTVPAGRAASAAQVHELLVWDRPRATAPASTVTAVLTEAETLGITGAGALTAAGRTLAGGGSEDEIAAALEAALPDPVGDLLVQGDLTAVVPGRPLPELAALLTLCTEVESRGSALTVRFTPESVRRALDAGVGATELLDALAGYSRTPLPQALEYLVRDAARRHGQVRVGAAGAYLRVDDGALATELTGNPALASLGLRTIAPTVLVSPAPPGEVLDVLREAGLAPVLEGPDGVVVLDGFDGGPVPARGAGAARPSRGIGRRGHRVPRGLPTYPGASAGTYARVLDDAHLGDVVARLRAGEEQARRDAERRADGAPAATDPVHALTILREAAGTGETLEIVVVGARGTPERRRVRALSVDGGRVRMADADRETEMTVAIHRISAVAPLPAD
ncbi:helicase-associated domain-containing protein [Georgenia subflava]|uniref:Helicase XPB/Ssl2 N-terminal domain-containing protein n=1 Tax=Georgenia subflava TaxID=1622177 RepID=A0A6N7EKM0_9MICO|nr:helicase-associated domain-containing protein [Georgenia subflava]MPV37971.1 hypothetical protein [Georgenia subflava]